jgi:hypothetical protein
VEIGEANVDQNSFRRIKVKLLAHPSHGIHIAGRLIGWMNEGEEEVTCIGQAFRRGNKRLRPSKASGPACPLLLLWGLTGHPVLYCTVSALFPCPRCLCADFVLVLLCFSERTSEFYQECCHNAVFA